MAKASMVIYKSEQRDNYGDRPSTIDMAFCFESLRICMGTPGSHSWDVAHDARDVFALGPRKVCRVPLL